MNDMTRLGTGSHDDVIRTDVATGVLNRARTLVYARIYPLEKGSDAERQEGYCQVVGMRPAMDR